MRTSETPSVDLKTLRFEALKVSHIPDILEIEKVVNTAPWSERSFRNELENQHAIFLVALLQGKIVAYGGVWLVVDEAHVTTIAVAEEFRRQHIGSRLMAELLIRAQKQGMVCSTLEVRASNVGAIRMYEKFGYVVTTTRKGYYPDNKEDAAVMWLYHLEAWEPPTV